MPPPVSLPSHDPNAPASLSSAAGGGGVGNDDDRDDKESGVELSALRAAAGRRRGIRECVGSGSLDLDGNDDVGGGDDEDDVFADRCCDRHLSRHTGGGARWNGGEADNDGLGLDEADDGGRLRSGAEHHDEEEEHDGFLPPFDGGGLGERMIARLAPSAFLRATALAAAPPVLCAADFTPSALKQSAHHRIDHMEDVL